MRDLIYFVTCGFWTNRQVWNDLPLNSSNSRGLHKRQSIFVRLSFYYPCYFRDKVINCEVCVHMKYVSKLAGGEGWVRILAIKCVSFFLFFSVPTALAFFHDQTHTLTQTRKVRRHGERPKGDRTVRFTRFLDYRFMFDSGPQKWSDSSTVLINNP